MCVLVVFRFINISVYIFNQFFLSRLSLSLQHRCVAHFNTLFLYPPVHLLSLHHLSYCIEHFYLSFSTCPRHRHASLNHLLHLLSSIFTLALHHSHYASCTFLRSPLGQNRFCRLLPRASPHRAFYRTFLARNLLGCFLLLCRH